MSKYISVTTLRKDLFNAINAVYLSGTPVVVEKGGIPLVVISSVKNFQTPYEEVATKEKIMSENTLNDSRGVWEEDTDWDVKQRERDKLEKAIVSKLKSLW